MGHACTYWHAGGIFMTIRRFYRYNVDSEPKHMQKSSKMLLNMVQLLLLIAAFPLGCLCNCIAVTCTLQV